MPQSPNRSRSASTANRDRGDSTTTEPVEVDLCSSTPHTLHQTVYARRNQYIRPHRIRVKIGSWNVAACPGTDKDLASWFVDGKGLEAKLASLDLAHNSAVETDSPSTNTYTNTNPAPDGDVEQDKIHILGGDKIGLYVLGLQEVVDLNAASRLVTRTVYGSSDDTLSKWKVALEKGLPKGYELVAEEQMMGLLTLVYASPEVAKSISNVSTVAIGTGLLGYMGNKGAICTRILLGETTRMVFVNCHLASGIEANFVERRVWDVSQILSRTQFKPVEIAGGPETDGTNNGEKIGDEDFTFWFGDLNFRLDGLPGDDIRHLLMLHSRGEYDLSKKGLPREDSLEGQGIFVPHSPDSSDEEESEFEADTTRSTTRSSSTEVTTAETDDSLSSLPDPDEFAPDPHDDPASLQATLDSLLPHDQLRKVIKDRKAFHDGWHEGPITFLPSYKYDVGTVGLFDSSEKRRAPSWCDRILFRTRSTKEGFERKVKEEEEARKRDEEMKARGIDTAGEDDEVLFDYDPDNDGSSTQKPQGTPGADYDEYDETEDYGAEETVVTKEGFVDRIHLEIYTSHQRITSSDHKPIVSIFTLDYDGVVPELKAKIHAEVARELDRAENEGRPGITIVVDSQDKQASSGQGQQSSSEGQVVNLGEVRFLRKATSVLTLANTGGVPATFSFVEKPTTEETDGTPQWLKTSFIRSDPPSDDTELVELGKEVTLEPGETVNAVLEVLIDDISHARLLNGGEASLEEVLVLRVTDGRDHFIPARAYWAPTCIGRSIDELIRVPKGGIRDFAHSLAQKKGNMGSIPYDLDVHSAAPRELFHLTEALERLTERALADEQMLDNCEIPKEAGWPFVESLWTVTDKDLRTSRVIDVIDALDSGKSPNDAFPPDISSIERLETVAEVLVLFLRGLTDGIITTVLWNRIEQAPLPSLAQPSSLKVGAEDVEEEDKTTILDILSAAPNHNISFVFLTAALAKMATDLAPISKADMDALRAAENTQPTSSAATGTGPVGVVGRGIGALGRRSLSFRKSGAGPTVEALVALERRRAVERKFADVFGGVVCRAPVTGGMKGKEKKAVEERTRGVVELFLRRRDG
ncbi:putative PI phosphatase [Rhypophila decipiens]|uniref:PI phosphatase n=1 Tax=Rhypophila decipiens TaxID=261697 RepID=A0AAN6Y2F7_9PEZI|nr:putative PI phosphatase [Rhypophila decipiens]